MKDKKLHRINTDWRASLRKNNRRTTLVIGTFFLIYAAIGMLVDMYLVSMQTSAYLSDIFFALITFQVFPLATVIMLGVAAVALLITFKFHDKLMLMGTEYHEVSREKARTTEEMQLYNVVEELKVAAGLQYMPKVFIIEANYMNAFATGYSEKSAMVAITRGLLMKLDRSELQAVMAHELSHVRHMDIKLTLMASVLANIMAIVIDILFYNAIFSGRRNREEGHNALFLIIMLIRFLLPVVTVLLMMYLSRTREYMADAGAVELMRDNEPMARALIKINDDHYNHKEEYAREYRSNAHESVRHQAYLYDPNKAGINPFHSFADLFSTHPSLKKRLQAIGFKIS